MLSAGIAGIGGVLLAFSQSTIQVSTVANFSVFAGILVIAVCVIGGVGFVGGAILGSTLMAGGVVSQLLSGWPRLNDYLPLIGGIVLILVLLTQPQGLFETSRRALAMAAAPAQRLIAPALATLPHASHAAYAITPRRAVEPKALQISGLSVSFGGIDAVRDVSLEIRPGEVHGLIGPNGAGKTTVIDAITGFVRPQKGTVLIGGVDITRWTARRRSGAGVARSFQSLELFDDLTILDNLAVATEQPHPVRYLTDLFRPGRVSLSPAAVEAIEEFELDAILHRKPLEISFGQRKTVAIARAIAASPSILLLDEPAAGLDDRETDELATLISRIAHHRDIGVLLVEHRVDMITSISDRITVLDVGRVIATGSPTEVISDLAVTEAYLGTPVTI
jgi:sulfate-transporting ATPase